MLINKIWRTLWQYKAQFIAMIIMIAFGVGIFNGFNMEWVSLEDDLGRFFDETTLADYSIYIESDENTADEDKIFLPSDHVAILDSGLVTYATRTLSLEAAVKERDGDNLGIYVPEDAIVSGFVLDDTSEPFDSRSEDGVWLSSQYAAVNGFSVGDPITLLSGEYTLNGRVAGLVCGVDYLVCLRDENQRMPDYETFGYAYVSPRLVSEAVGTNYIFNQMNVTSDLDKATFIQEVENLFPSKTILIVAKEDTTTYIEAQLQIEEGQIMSRILPALFLAISVLTMISTMNRLTIKEKLQIGTLKALGFKNRQIITHYSIYSIVIGILGITPGIGIGYLVAGIIMNPQGTMGTYFDMPYWDIILPKTCWVVTALLLLLFASVGAISVGRLLHGPAAQALRPYVPKRIKPLLIEKLKLFRKAKFATRWNLRDVFKNKIRTTMSIIGVAGCMMMLVSAVGLKDTMNVYVDVYYNGALGYTTRIITSDGTSKDSDLALAEKYGGNYSGSVAIETEGVAASLDVYNIDTNVEHKMIRFISAKDESYLDVPTAGAYICERLSKKLNVNLGDKITVHSYGKKDSFELVVVGIMRAVTQSIAISADYAKEIGINHDVDVIYTSATISEIERVSGIKDIQDKQTIMNAFDNFMELINLIIEILLVTSIILGSTVLYNLGMMGYTERYKDMATLKVLGFKNKAIGGILISQNLWITIAGIIIGFPAGYLILDYLIDELGNEYEMVTSIGPATVFVSVLVTLGVSIVVAIIIARKNRNIDMVEAMKGAE